MKVDIFISHHTNSSLHIVEAIVNKLEREGLHCWYAPRNTENAYADDITQAIYSCKVFLIILNKQSSESPHVKNELQIVTERLTKQEEVILIPFLLEKYEELSLGTQYYVGRFHRIDATRPPIYARIDELVEKITYLSSIKPEEANNDISLSGKYNYSLIEKVPYVRDIFIGREALLSEIKKRFESGNRILFLEGIGGIGKTELAKQFAVQNHTDYDQIIFATYLNNLKELVCDPAVFEVTGLTQRPDEPADEYFERKIQVLRMLFTDKTLVIIDNYDVDNDPDFNAFIQGRHNILFTSRFTHQNYSSLKVEPISDEKVMLDIFEMNYGHVLSEEDTPYIEELIRITECHTYTVELLAKQMSASFLTGKEILNILRQGQLASGIAEKIEGRTGKTTAFEHIKAVFSVNRLSDEEIQVMRELSLIGYGGINASLFKEWAGLKSFDLINGLIRRSWIRRENDRKISLHPLVQEIVREVLKPDTENCFDFLYCFGLFINTSWLRPYTENLLVKDNALAVLKYMQPFDGKYACMWAAYSSFLWQVGEFDASIYYEHIVFNTCLKSFGEASIATGFAAKALAGCYFNSGRLKESASWYERGLQCMLAAGGPETEDLAISYEKVARCATWEFFRDFVKAEKYFNIALDIRKRLLENLKSGQNPGWFEKFFTEYNISTANERIGETYMEMGRMYQAMGEYRKALECTELFTMNLEENNFSSFAYGLYDKGISYYHLGLEAREKNNNDEAERELNTALKNLSEALEINLRMRGYLALDTIANQEAVADTYAALHRYHEAANAYTAALTMAEKLLGENNSRAEAIKAKMEFK